MELPRAVADNYTLRKHLHEVHTLAEHDSAAALRRFNELFYPDNVQVPVIVPAEDKLAIYIAEAMATVPPCRSTVTCIECVDHYAPNVNSNGHCLRATRHIAAELLRRGVKLPTEE